MRRDLMILKGIEVKHKSFGIGVVSENIADEITITFSQGEKKFKYPDDFKCSIKATDDSVNDKIQKEIVDIEATKKEEEQKKPERAITNKANETNNITESRNGGEKYFFVFQNKTFEAERRGGYLWAPKLNKDGQEVPHWSMMKKVQKGDIILHSVNKNIIAISKATSDCYSKKQPEELKKEQMWEDDGYMVDCEYFDIKYPIVTSDYMDTILELQPAKYAPFHGKGRGNIGYLFESNSELSQFLIEKLLVENGDMKEVIDELVGFDIRKN